MSDKINLGKDILALLKRKNTAISVQMIRNELKDLYTQHEDLLSEDISKQLISLEASKLVYSRDHKDIYGQTNKLYALTVDGNKYFDPWSEKAWTFFTNDLAKILSILATFLSIIAIVRSFIK